MKTRWPLLATLLLSLTAQAETMPPSPVGRIARLVHPAEPRHWRNAGTRALPTTLWYPAETRSAAIPQEVGPPGSPIFVGHPVVPGAPVAAGRHPLILLSHGTGGSALSLDWLAGALAERGYIVAGVDHPGNNALEPLTVAGFRLWWERATDLSDALDAVLADPVIGPSIDPTRVGAAGFSLGGYTVLELAGARTDIAAFDRFCRSPAADAICRPPEMELLGPALSGLENDTSDPDTMASFARSGASFRDPRVRAILAIAPALGQAFDATGLAGIAVPVAIVAGDGDTTVPVATSARHIANLLPGASLDILPGGVSHYTFLDPCTPTALDHHGAICRDAPGVDRRAVHRWTVERAIAFFGSTLSGKAGSTLK